MKARSILILAIAAFAFGFFGNARAQTSTGPQVLITWKAVDSMAPAAYQGKALPGVGSKIVASVEVISNGGFANLGSRTIYWYLDGGLIGGGVGKQTVTFTANGYVGIMGLRVNIPNYPGGALINTAHIQMMNPQAVIVAPYPGKSFSQSPVQLQAIPYFFKTSAANKILFEWTVNGEAVATKENPQNLTINLAGNAAPGYALSVNLILQQSDDPLTTARASTIITKAN